MTISSINNKVIISLFCSIVIVTIFIASLFNNNLFLLLFTFVILYISLIPFLLQKTNLFSIWSFIFYSTFLVFLRTIYMVFGLADFEKLNQVFLRGKQIIDFVDVSMIMVISYLLLVLGYLLGQNKKYRIKKLNLIQNSWSEKRYLLVTISLIFISLTSIYIFVQSNGGLISGIISSARGVSDTLEDTNPQGYLRLFASLGFVNLFLTTSWLRFTKKYKFYSILVFTISFISYIFFNFFVSQRAAVVFIFVQLIALLYYSNKFKFSKIKFFAGVLISLTLFQVMSSLRNSGELSNTSFKFDIISAFEPAIMTINFIDISKTSHIIDAIPKKLPFAYGGTYFTSLYAPIPRSIWPKKPVVNVDNIVGQKVYGSNYFGAGGTPAGLIAEAYWNFWFFGIIFIPLLAGFVLRYIENTFQAYIDSKNIIIL